MRLLGIIILLLRDDGFEISVRGPLASPSDQVQLG